MIWTEPYSDRSLLDKRLTVFTLRVHLDVAFVINVEEVAV